MLFYESECRRAHCGIYTLETGAHTNADTTDTLIDGQWHLRKKKITQRCCCCCCCYCWLAVCFLCFTSSTVFFFFFRFLLLSFLLMLFEIYHSHNVVDGSRTKPALMQTTNAKIISAFFLFNLRRFSQIVSNWSN